MRDMIYGVYNLKSILIGLMGLWGANVLAILSQLFGEKFAIYGIFALIIALLIIILVFFRGHGKYKQRIKLRNYGETWVRHEATVAKLELEMFKYLRRLGEYGDLNVACGDSRFFEERILKILEANEEIFQNNMKDIYVKQQ